MKYTSTCLLFALSLCFSTVFALDNHHDGLIPNIEGTSMMAVVKPLVLLKPSSDTSTVPAQFQVIYAAGQSPAYEDCNTLSMIRISRTNGDTSQSLTVPVLWSGTAIGDLDYSLPPSSLVIPAGQFYIDAPILVFSDGFTEPEETIVITLDDSCACVTDTLRIQDLPALSVDLSNATILPGATATLIPAVTGGAPSFSYLWNNDSTTMSITTGTTGLYYVTVTDQCGQIATDGATVSYPDTNCTYNDPIFIPDEGFAELPLVIAGALNPTLGVNGQGLCGVKLNFDHEYLGDLTINLKSPSGQVVNLVGPTGLFGPTDFTTWEVTMLPCSAIAEPDPGFLAQWNNNQPWGMFSNFTGSYYPFNGCLESFVGPVNGAWTLTVQDGQAVDVGNFFSYELIFCDPSGLNCTFCSNSAPITYTKPPKVFCIDDLPFTWDESPFTVINGSGTYELNSSGYTSASGCDSIVKQTITVINPFTSIISIATQLNCSRDSITLFSEPFFGSPGVSIKTWTNLSTGETTEADTYAIGAPGDYALTNTVTYDSTSCSYSDTITITSEPKLLEMSVFGGNQGCAGNIVQLSIFPGQQPDWTYLWTGPEGFLSNTPLPMVDIPGDYTLMVSNAQGCSASSVATVTPGDPAPDITTQGGMLDCQTGFAQIFGSSTTPDVNYTWTGPDGFLYYSQFPFVTVSGVYSLTVSTNNGCTNTAEAVVTEPPPPPSISFVTPLVVNCATPATLICLTNATQAQYYWSGPENFSSSEPTPVVDMPGFYSVTVTDAATNCTASAVIQVEADTISPAFQIIQVVQPSNGLPNGSINISTSGAPGPISYVWYYNGYAFPYAFTEDITNLAPGSYACIAIAANGCSNVTYVTLENFVATYTTSDGLPWRIRPNPSAGHFVLCCSKDAEPIRQLRVYESSGRLIREQIPGKMQDEYLIDLADEAEGVYFLEVRGEKGSVWMKLVVAR